MMSNPTPLPPINPSVSAASGARRYRVWIIALFAVGLLGLLAVMTQRALRDPDPQETVIRGQTQLAVGCPAALRIYVRHRGNDRPVVGAQVDLRLRGKAGTTRLAALVTGADGSSSEPLTIPELPPGDYTLVVDVASRLGRDHLERRVALFQPGQLFLTTDKPLYQPGQTIHLRSLALNGRTRKPRAGEAVVLEVSDGKGNRVFRAERTTSRFGLASADFVLASEVNLGRYHVQAMAAAAKAERTVEVKPYVLPKFKVAIAPERTWYRPGQVVAGTLSAQYVFGKPVAGARVEITAEALDQPAGRARLAERAADVEPGAPRNEARSAGSSHNQDRSIAAEPFAKEQNAPQDQPARLGPFETHTDAQGNAAFRLTLPDHFVGLPQTGGSALLDITARVVDAAGHAEQATVSLPVSAVDLTLAIVPENGALVPGVENLVYLLTAYPDGSPAECEVTANNQRCRTDATGVAVLPLVAHPAGLPLTVSARDATGRTASALLPAEAAGGTAALLVRADQAAYQAGQTARLTILTTEPAGTVFVDVVRDRQTVLTRSVAMTRGRGELALDLTPDLSGLLRINAYLISPTGEDRGNARLIYVRPPSDLQISTKTDQAVYGPGGTARLDIAVRDAAGKPTVAALGISTVDESVFAIGETQPGLLGQLLTVEGERLKPRYQLKFFDSPAQVLGGASDRPTLAQAYLAALATESDQAHQVDPKLEDYLGDKRMIERVRRWRGTPELEALRTNPNFAAAIRFVEGPAPDFEWRERTGPAKALAAEQRQRRFLENAKRVGLMLLVGALVPVLVGTFYVSARGRVRRSLEAATAGANDRRVVETAVLQQTALGYLFLFPFLWYPAGLVTLEGARLSGHGMAYAPLIGEVMAVLGILAWRGNALLKLPLAGGTREARTLAWVLALFLGQFALIRLAILDAAVGGPGSSGGELLWLWLLAAVIVPCAVLGYGSRQIRRILATRGLGGADVYAGHWAEVAVVAVILFILAGMLLPALAKSKAKSMRINAANDLKQVDIALQMAKDDGALQGDGSGGSPAPRLRKHFPETLFWQPELITDEQGRATVDIPLADSITTWRTSLDAVSAAGQMGSAEVPLRVFQDFFVDLDLPVALSLGDELTVPVMCYNYLGTPQTVRLTLREDDWFSVAGTDRTQAVTLAANEVKAVHFPIRAQRVGTHRLVVTAQGAKVSDAIEREIRVAPTGEAIDRVENGVLRDRADFGFNVPSDAIPGSASLLLKIYPSRFSEIVEGLDTIFQAPYGCFEQTSATTYPNVLALEYLQSVGRLTPELEVKARTYINAGYQRLLTFEVPGGGFEWFGHSPANVCLSAYGVLEFTDLARVHPVDEKVIDRTIAWLASVQGANGVWQENHRGATWAGPGPITAFVAWALAESGRRPASLDKALDYLRTHQPDLSTTYAQALAANAFLARNPQDAFGRELTGRLLEQACRRTAGQVNWASKGASMTYSTGPGLAIETTALAALALAKTGEAPETLNHALAWLSAAKCPNGTWGTTQATILAMRALLKATSSVAGRETNARLTVLLNGRRIESLEVNGRNRDLLQLVSLTKYLAPGENRLDLQLEPRGELAYQAAGAYWVATGKANVNNEPPPELEIRQRYDRTTLSVNDSLQCAVTALNRTPQTIPMAIVDLGIPAGFDVDPHGFQALQTQGRIARYELTGRQVILYLRDLAAGAPLEFTYRLRPKYPLRVAAPRASVYEYYTPTRRAWSPTTSIEVTR